MTSDGITQKDWGRVCRISMAIFNSIMRHNDKSVENQKAKLFACLDRLEAKYGELPSIVGARADFEDNQRKRVRLWKRAYHLAQARQDFKNVTLIASSLADYFIDERQDKRRGRYWLKRLAEALARYDIPDERKLMRRLSVALRALDPKRRSRRA